MKFAFFKGSLWLLFEESTILDAGGKKTRLEIKGLM